MAGDWIKIEKVTPEKPELSKIAKLCGVSRGDAFLGFFRLWRYFDDHCVDGFMDPFAREDADEYSGVSGFGGALSQVGWLHFDSGGVVIHNWDRHNGKSGKARALKNRRQSSWRDRRKQHV